MPNSQDITLFTSIPPKLQRLAGTVKYGEAYQNECINSWISAGFRVTSINPKEEIAYLEKQHPQVKFLDSGSKDSRTRIDIFLGSIASAGERISGIINADCYLLNFGSIVDMIRTHSGESMVLLKRLNIESTVLRPIGQGSPGFDGFVFDTRFLSSINRTGQWVIGAPWWDFWFPIAMHFAGARLRLLDTPVLLHLNHEQRWDDRDFDTQATLLWNVLRDHSGGKMTGQLLERAILCGVDLSIQDRKVQQITECMVPWLYHQSETIHLTDESVKGNFLSRVLSGLEGSQEASLRHQLETVTFRKWLRSKRDAICRLRDRIRS